MSLTEPLPSAGYLTYYVSGLVAKAWDDGEGNNKKIKTVLREVGAEIGVSRSVSGG